MKECKLCLEVKDFSEFAPNKKSKDRLNYKCRVCTRKIQRDRYAEDADWKKKRIENARAHYEKETARIYSSQWRKNNPEKQKAKQFRERIVAHNITVDEYIGMCISQDYKCLICNQVKKLVIDHDHACCSGARSCGKCIRGLLCFGCNNMLGLARDNLEILERAKDYVQRKPSQKSIEVL